MSAVFGDEEGLKQMRNENERFYLEIKSLWIFERIILVEWREIETRWK